MASKRNITLTLDEAILKEARVLAAQEGLSVSGLLRRELVHLVERQRGYAKARESAIRRLKRGQSLGVERPMTKLTALRSAIDEGEESGVAEGDSLAPVRAQLGIVRR